MTNTTKSKAIEAEAISPALVAFANLAERVPWNATDGIDGILGQIMAAQTVEQLADAWGSQNTENVLDRPLTVTGISKSPSEVGKELGFFLVVEYIDKTTGAQGVFTTGSISVVAQLCKAYVEGWMPLDVLVRKADRPTADGFYPMHLELIGVSF